jgi:hypothetical protein
MADDLHKERQGGVQGKTGGVACIACARIWVQFLPL